MIDKEYLEYLKKKFNEFEENKDEVINIGIKINRLSKSLIYSLIRNDKKSAESYLKEMKENFKKLKEYIEKDNRLSNYAQISFQEYTEGIIFYEIITNNRIPKHDEIGVDEFSYVSGLIDVAGELYRKSVEEMINGNMEFALKTREFLGELYQSLLYMEFKNYDYRRKLDYVAGVYNNLIEKIFYKNSHKDIGNIEENEK